jgi:CBS domain-containing protein
MASQRGDQSVVSLLKPGGGDGENALLHVHLDQSLSQVLARMGESRRTVLPVVSRANAGILLGLVTLGDVLDAYGVANGEGARTARRGQGGT